MQETLRQAAGSAHGVPVTGMTESAARTAAAAGPAAAETVVSGTTTVGTAAQADPVPDTALASLPPGVPHGSPEAKAAAAAAKAAAMEAMETATEAATEAAKAETTAAATAAMTPQANEAKATEGEVVADGSATTPAEAATTSTSHLLARRYPNSLDILTVFIFSLIKIVSQYVLKRKNKYAVYSNLIYKKT